MTNTRLVVIAELYCHASAGIHAIFGRNRNRPTKWAWNDQPRGPTDHAHEAERSLRHRRQSGARLVVFMLHVTGAQTKFETAIGKDIHCGCRAGEQDGVAEVVIDHQGPDPKSLCGFGRGDKAAQRGEHAVGEVIGYHQCVEARGLQPTAAATSSPSSRLPSSIARAFESFFGWPKDKEVTAWQFLDLRGEDLGQTEEGRRVLSAGERKIGRHERGTLRLGTPGAGHAGTGALECPGAGVPGCRSARVPECPGAGVPGCRSARVPECPGAGGPGATNSCSFVDHVGGGTYKSWTTGAGPLGPAR
jgi:hypothetical protein